MVVRHSGRYCLLRNWNLACRCLALLDVAVFEWGFDWENRFGMNLLAIPLGLLADVSLYFFLKNRWKITVVLVKDEIQDIGKPTEE